MKIGERQLATGNRKGPRLASLALCTMLLALCVSGYAQQPKIPRIGYILGTGDSANQGPYVEALRQGLRDLGYTEKSLERLLRIELWKPDLRISGRANSRECAYDINGS